MTGETKKLFVFDKKLFDEIVQFGHHEKHIVEYVESRFRDREDAEYCYSRGMRTGHGVRPSPCRTDDFIKSEERLMSEYHERVKNLDIKLYDMDQRDYPNKRGDSFRSLQAYRCRICGAISNRVVMGGWPGYGVRMCCPNSSECWHHVLEQKINWLGHPHPKPYKHALEEEIETFRKKYIGRSKNDIQGKPILTDFGGMTNTYSTLAGVACDHREFEGETPHDR